VVGESCSRFLEERLHLTPAQAYGQVRTARRLGELPQTSRAFGRSDLSAAHLTLISRGADQVGIDPVRDQEEVLVEAARQLDPRMLRQVTVHLRHCLDPDGADLKGASASDPGIRIASVEQTTLRYMSSEAIRIESETLRALRERSAQSGEPMVRLAQRYIGEGMRLDRHPGIVFRNGPAGRRAVVVGGPDVWEVIAAARNAPEHGEELVSALAERIGVPVEKIRIAVRYYAEYPEEIDRFIEMVEQEAKQLERTLDSEGRLLG
jgi:hypothetical protein